MELKKIQQALKARQLDGWLFYDFHNRDAIGMRILGLDPKKFTSRRWYYYLPAEGEPQKLVHSIEQGRLEALPGQKWVYLPWQQQHQLLKNMLGQAKTIAMQYSPLNAIPYISMVDAGTIELIQSFGIRVVSSADLVGVFEAHLSPEDYQSHCEAGKILDQTQQSAFAEIGRRIRLGQSPTELEIHQFMRQEMQSAGLFFEDGPIVAVNAHAADPHFEPTAQNTVPIKQGDLVLLDLWGKMNRPGSIYADITWMGFVGDQIPARMLQVFNVVKQARDQAVAFLEARFAAKKPVYGWEVDDATRQVIVKAGFGEYFIHRTGHNIGIEVHGNGVHLDNLETKDERQILPGTCFSDEPGIYLPQEKLGFRTEIDIFITEAGEVVVTGPRQQEIVKIPV
ncbi:Xaa-Pro peptidase family protein [candidate division KSB1 bacterium]|nr:Xaa-Pro peptidase family protein [candidate division KSB1 bacterium]